MNANPTAGPAGASAQRIEIRNQDHVATIELPPGWVDKSRAVGVRLLPAGHAELRNPPQIDLQLAPEPAPGGAWPQQHDLGGRQARYRLETTDGGSGGDAALLTAWVACGAGHLLLRYSQQAEAPARHDWSLAWAVLRSAACPKS